MLEQANARAPVHIPDATMRDALGEGWIDQPLVAAVDTIMQTMCECDALSISAILGTSLLVHVCLLIGYVGITCAFSIDCPSVCQRVREGDCDCGQPARPGAQKD